MSSLDPAARRILAGALARHGLRATRQREVVWKVVHDQRDHPTADAIFERARRLMPKISMATVYNCLDTFKACGLVRQVNLKRHATRFCPDEGGSCLHAHFYCTRTGRVLDIELTPEVRKTLESILPEGFRAEEVELSFRGMAA